MLNVVFLDAAAFPANFQIRKPEFPHNWTVYQTTAADQAFERSKDADIIITSKVIFDEKMLKSLADLGKLKLIQITATGTNNVDLDAARKYGITVQNVDGYSASSVSEHVIGAIFSLARGAQGWSRDQMVAKWVGQPIFTYFDYPIYDVAGKTLTIIGKGAIGKLVAKKAEALGLNVLYAERPDAQVLRQGYTEFNQAIRQADFISLHCPLTATTAELVNQAFLKNMKKNAFLINTGRGGLIDEQALTNALREKRIGGAALDVLSVEPPTMENPLIQLAVDAPNLIITPHIAFASQQSLRKLADLVIERIETFVKQNYVVAE